MAEFWMCFVIMGLVGVPAILLFALCGGDAVCKIGGSAMVLAFWLLISVACTFEMKWDVEAWNNGICSVCEGEYKFSGATKYRTSHHYYYTCENCDHTIELNSLMK